MQEYVAGFAISVNHKHVLLIEKKHPMWQAGKLNAVGGKIEPNETAYGAMIREFKEETNLCVTSWHNLCVLSGEGFKVHFYYANIEASHMRESRQMTDEAVDTYPVENILLGRETTIPNVPWLLAMALSFSNNEGGFLCASCGVTTIHLK